MLWQWLSDEQSVNESSHMAYYIVLWPLKLRSELPAVPSVIVMTSSAGR